MKANDSFDTFPNGELPCNTFGEFYISIYTIHGISCLKCIKQYFLLVHRWFFNVVILINVEDSNSIA